MVTAIIVSYKNEKQTCDYVNKELTKCKDISHVIVVVNSATEEEVDYIYKGIPESEVSENDSYTGARVVILPSKENQGFARANNQGARYARRFWNAEYLLFSNDDIIINDSNVITELVKKIDEDLDIGCIGPKILKVDGSTQGPGEYLSLWKRYALLSIYPVAQRVTHAFMDRKRKKGDSFKKEGTVYIVVGCFFLVKTADFEKVGMMDEHTFLYREEEILAEKWKKIGKYDYWLPSVSVTHLVGQSTYKNKKRTYNLVNKYTRESDLYYYHEYMGYPLWQIRMVQGIQKVIGALFG